MPKSIFLLDIENEIQSGILLAIPDPFAKNFSDEDLTKKQIQKRDVDWRIVSESWNIYKEALLNKKEREKTLSEIAIKYGMTKIKVKRVFTRFWQRGLNKNALLPDYIYSGGKGKERNLSANSKVGRPRKYTKDEGISITEDVKKQFSYAIKKYYRKKEKLSLMETYENLSKGLLFR